MSKRENLSFVRLPNNQTINFTFINLLIDLLKYISHFDFD